MWDIVGVDRVGRLYDSLVWAMTVNGVGRTLGGKDDVREIAGEELTGLDGFII